LALSRYKTGVIPVIIASGLAGFLLAFLKPWLAQKGIFL
jgi:chromate transporter